MADIDLTAVTVKINEGGTGSIESLGVMAVDVVIAPKGTLKYISPEKLLRTVNKVLEIEQEWARPCASMTSFEKRERDAVSTSRKW